MADDTAMRTAGACQDIEWRVCPGFENYQVSENGDIRRATFTPNRKGKPGDIIQHSVSNNGYARVALWEDAVSRRVSVHRLVAFAFIGTPPTRSHEVAHNDGNRLNNHYTNLRWATRSENHADKKAHGTWQGGGNNGNGKLTENAVFEILQRLRAGARRSALAREYGVSYTTIWSIESRRTWKHVGVKEFT